MWRPFVAVDCLHMDWVEGLMTTLLCCADCAVLC